MSACGHVLIYMYVYEFYIPKVFFAPFCLNIYILYIVYIIYILRVCKF